MEYSINKSNLIIHDEVSNDTKSFQTAVVIHREDSNFESLDFWNGVGKTQKLIHTLTGLIDEIDTNLLSYGDHKTGDIVEIECTENSDMIISWLRYANKWYINDVKDEPVLN